MQDLVGALTPGRNVYDPALDRFDVGIRAVARACRLGNRSILAQLGIPAAQREAVMDAVAELDKPLKTEAGVFELLERCPFVLDYALVLLATYQQNSSISRDYYYAGYLLRKVGGTRSA